MEYYRRYIETQIKEALDTSGAVVVAGPKFCGKTTTCRLFAESEYDLDTRDKIHHSGGNSCCTDQYVKRIM